jgi:uridine kinase
MLVAIVGGSGSGKTWLAEKLKRALAPKAACVSLDDFYTDRSHLSPRRRARLNFDHPRAIDWPALERVLEQLYEGQQVRVPCYDFETHSRLSRTKVVRPKPIILIEGLWLLRRASIRRLISVSIFVDCPSGTRLRRRITRDVVSRGRTDASIRRQFLQSVEPMHKRFVVPQINLADCVLSEKCDRREIRRLAGMLKDLLGAKT